MQHVVLVRTFLFHENEERTGGTQRILSNAFLACADGTQANALANAIKKAAHIDPALRYRSHGGSIQDATVDAVACVRVHDINGKACYFSQSDLERIAEMVTEPSDALSKGNGSFNQQREAIHAFGLDD